MADELSLLGLKIDFGNFTHPTPDTYTPLGWIVWLPVLGALFNGIWGKKLGRQAVHIAGIGAVAASFLLSCITFLTLLKAGHTQSAEGVSEGAHAAGRAITFVMKVPSIQQVLGGLDVKWVPWDWFLAPTGSGTGEMIRMRYVVDPLSGVMLLVVTGIGLLIHVYSAGYMSHDGGYGRFFAYLNLFIFAMLNLILGDSLVLLFLGWEGVGLASYLLIGFWFTNGDYAFAGRKAFVVNRIGDAALLMGMAILAWKGGTYHFETLRAHISARDAFWMALTERTGLGNFILDALPFLGQWQWLGAKLEAINPSYGGLAALLLFIGACGKSAQFPLYVWLPDAMAGPTPVSALIHAATMVTAGIYLLCRLSFFYIRFTSVLNVVAFVGAFTALFAATIAVAQVELKKVLAYSTVSQLGFMFVGCGVGAFSAGFFHVFTHAFFKACMFLGAGAVMHACGDRQDIRVLGGLRRYLPTTTLTFGVATACIIGVPLTSGFFSKDEILFRALAHGWAPGFGRFIYGMGIVAATLTAFYMCRLFILTFLDGDKPKFLDEEVAQASGDHDEHGHDGHGHGPPSEQGLDMKLMTTPLIVLAAFALVVGVLGLPHGWTHREGILPAFQEHVIADGFQFLPETAVTTLRGKETLAMVGGVFAWLAGMGLAYWVYVLQKGEPARKAAQMLPGLYQLVVDKWRVDELYDRVIVRPVRGLASFVAIFDRFFIDLIVNLVGWVALIAGRVLRPLQTGAVQVYGAFIGLGALLIFAFAIALPNAEIAQRVQGNTVTLTAGGGPGYVYRWAFYDPDREATVDTLDARCPMRAAEMALSPPPDAAGTPVLPVPFTSQARRDESLSAPRCVVLEVRNAFGRTARARALVVPGAATVVVPGTP
jgi:NADH-quinone oxidoreductase subunit L